MDFIDEKFTKTSQNLQIWSEGLIVDRFNSSLGWWRGNNKTTALKPSGEKKKNVQVHLAKQKTTTLAFSKISNTYPTIFIHINVFALVHL